MYTLLSIDSIIFKSFKIHKTTINNVDTIPHVIPLSAWYPPEKRLNGMYEQRKHITTLFYKTK